MPLPGVRRSILFFPGSRPELFPKALASGADAVCVDLEDAVAPGDKEVARKAVAELLREGRPDHVEVILRCNSLHTLAGLADLRAMAEAGASADAYMVPKVDGPGDLETLDGLLREAGLDGGLLPLVETARGRATVEEIATAVDRITGIVLGGVDLQVELGGTRSWQSLLYARSRVVHAAALAGGQAIDSPFMDVEALDALREEAAAVRDLGFGGKLAIHPRQVAPIQETFTPSQDEIDGARRIITAYENNRQRVLLVDGKLVERPVIESSRRVLAIADAAARRGEQPHHENTPGQRSKPRDV